MKMKKRMKSVVAMVALIAMLLENTYSVFAEIPSNTFEAEDVLLDAGDESITIDEAQEEVSLETEAEEIVSEEQGIELETDTKEIDIAVNTDSDEELEAKEASIIAKEGFIDVDGVSNITLYINTDQMNSKDTFGLDFDGAAGLSYDNKLDGILGKNSSGIYYIDGLGNEGLVIKATNLSNDLQASYKIREDGNPQITLVSAETSNNVKNLKISPNGKEVNGLGYDTITIKFDTEELAGDVYFDVIFDTASEASCGGHVLNDGTIFSLSNKSKSTTVTNLNKDSFSLHIVGENVDDVVAEYSIDSIENGAITAKVFQGNTADSEESTKRVYTYEDSKVSVTAKLEVIDAIPDDADFVVTPVTASTAGYNFDAYMQALNDESQAVTGDSDRVISEGDVLLYDIAFFGYDKQGNYVELQPDDGTVKITIKFKDNQLSEVLEAEDNSDITVVHMPLIDSVKNSVDSTAEATEIVASDIKVDVVADSASVDNESADFTLSDFSLTAIVYNGKKYINPGNTMSFENALGNARYYGVTAREITLAGHMETNFATKKLNGNAQIASGRNSSGGETYIGAYTGSDFTMDRSGQNASDVLIYTTKEAYSKMGFNMTNGRNGVVVDTTKYTAEEINNKVDTLVTTAQNNSTVLSKVEGYKYSDIVSKSDGKSVIDIASMGTSDSGTYYIDFAPGEFQTIGHYIIKLKKNQNVIFNIPDSEVSFGQFTYVVDGKSVTTSGNTEDDTICQKLIFNCYNAKKAYTSAPTAGCFLVPFADFATKAVSAGWVVANTISSIGGQEWHCVWHDMPAPDLTGCGFSIKAKKTVNSKTPASGESFTFGLFDEKGNAVLDSTGRAITATNDSNGIITFPELTFADNYNGYKEFTYYVKEVAGDNNAYKYSTDQYKVIIKVKTNSNMKNSVESVKILKSTNGSNCYNGVATLCGAADTTSYVAFNNEKISTVPADFSINVKKTFEGTWNNDAKVKVSIEKFKMSDTEEVPDYVWNQIKNKVIYLTPDNTTGSFGTITFDADYLNGYGPTYGVSPSGTVKYHVYMFKITEELLTEDDSVEMDTAADYNYKYSNPSYLGYNIDKRGTRYLKVFVNTVTKDNRVYEAKIQGKVKGNTVTNTCNDECQPCDGTIEYINYRKVYPLTITKKDATDGKALAGVTFRMYKEDGSPVYVSGSEGSYSVSKSSRSQDLTTGSAGSLTIQGLEAGKYYFVEKSTLAGYKAFSSSDKFTFTVGKDGISNTTAKDNNKFVFSGSCNNSIASYVVKNQRQNGRLDIEKINAITGKGMDGVEFELYFGSAYIGSLKTSNGGKASMTNLEWGTYTLKEKTPSGFVQNTTEYKFTIDKDNLSKSFTGDNAIVNTPISGGVKLVKSDKDTSKAMAGVTFHLYDAKGSAIYSVLKNGEYTYCLATAANATNSYVTDSKGTIKVTGIPYGNGYYFTEQTPEGYVVNNSNYSFNVVTNGGLATVDVKNNKIYGYVELYKYDASSKASLSGAKFALYTEDGTKIAEYTTDNMGMISTSVIGALEYGKYYFMELSAPNGYNFDATKKYSFEIKNASNKAVRVEASNDRKPGQVSLVKYDANSGKTLDGAEFGLYLASDLSTPIAKATSKNGGKISFTGLEWNKYVIKEISAPTGYKLNDKAFNFEISSTNLSVDLSKSYTIDNEELPGAIRLIKNDGEGHTLEGAKFELYKDGKRYPDSNTVYTCDSNGEIYVDGLPWGTYYFVEVYAPEGFVLPEGDAAKSSSITIDSSNTINALTKDEKASGATVHVNVIAVANEKIYGSLLLHKVDEKGNSLTGATFKLYSVDKTSGKETEVKTSGSKGSYKYDVNGASQILDTDAKGDLNVTGLPFGNYCIIEQTAPNGYNRDTNPRYFDIEKQAQVAEYNFENTLVKANVKFIKVNDKDEALKGASFTLYKLVNGEYKPLTNVNSDEDGYVYVEGLGTGEYYFAENEFTGYEVNDTHYSFTISASDNQKTITLPGITRKIGDFAAVVNVPKKGTAKIKKVEEGKTVGLEGAKFALYDATTKTVVKGCEALVTDSEGYATASNLPWGSYYFVETAAPKYYALDPDTQYPFEINAENVSDIINVGTASDKLILGGGKLVKKDSTDKSAISGAVFALYDSSNKVVAGYESIISDDNGLIQTDLSLKEGTYYFKEISAPEGYTFDSELKYIFTVNQANMGTLVEANAEGAKDNTAWNGREPGKVELYKYIKDASKMVGLEGATFELYMGTKTLGIFNTKKLIGEYSTNSEGIIMVDNLEWGDYYFVEKNAPFGYDTDDSKIEFTISRTLRDFTGSARLTFENKPSTGSIQLIKTDENDGTKLAGASFKLWQSVDGATTQIVNAKSGDGLYVTDDNGSIVVTDLSWGTYYFEEVSAPGFYELPADTITDSVVINRDNVEASVKSPLTINVTNRKVYGSVELYKTNEDGTIVLEGAEFELYSDSSYKNKVYATDNGNSSYTYSTSKFGAKSTFITNNEGKLSIDNIPVGTYYFKEISAPEGYIVETVDAGMFTIDEKNTADNRKNVNLKIVCVKDQRIKGYVELIKVDDKDDDTKLNGVSFDLYKIENKGQSNQTVKKLDGYVTVNGMISKDTIGALEYGDYYFVEVGTVDGYKLNTEAYYFSISEQDKVITVTAKNTRENGEVSLIKYNSDKTKALNGAEFELYSSNANGVVQKLSTIFGTDYHKYGTYSTANGGEISVKDLPWGNYYFVETKAPTGYVTDNQTKYYFTIDAKNLKVSLASDKGAVNKEEPGAIKLIKNDGEGNTLEGAVFELYKDGERYPNAEKTYTTDKNGEILVENLPYGTYYFVEVYAPEKFVLPEGDAAKTSSVVIDENTTISTVDVNIITFANEKIYGSLKLKKVDSDGNELKGAKFALVSVIDGDEKNVKVDGAAGSYTYNKTAGFLSTKQILDTNGAYLEVTGLPYGTYRVYEEKAPEGYNRVDSPFEFKIDSQGKIATVNFENSLILANVEFLKADADGKSLENAVFHLYKKGLESDIDYGTVTSDSKGIVAKKGIGAGEYYFVEDSAPLGYIKSSKVYEFKITAEDNNKTVTINNADRVIDGKSAVVNTPKNGSVKLWKIEKGTNNGLKGALFDLYIKGQDTPIKRNLASNDSGYVVVDDLAWGTYFFKETKAPEGYVLNEKSEYSFVINAENVDAVVEVDIEGNELIVENELILGQAKLTKKNSVTGQVISGAVFALYSAKDDSVVEGYSELVTDKDGIILTNKDLPYGNYYFKEITPATGYEINNTKYEFTINHTNMDKVVLAGNDGIALNVPKKGQAELFKFVKEGDSQKGLADAEFTLYVKDSVLGFIKYNKEYDVYKTNADGIIKVTDLPWGEYYFQETKEPVGYKLDDTKIEFTISATQLDYTGEYRLSLENTPLKGSVKLIKTYSVNNEVKGNLEGAAFRFYMVNESGAVEIANNTADGLYYTDKNGEIVITDLAWGSYYFYEEAVPTGYALPDNCKSDIVTIDSSNVEESIKTPLTVTVDNKKIYGNVQLIKVDDATPANALSGATFELYTKDGKRVFVNGADGVFSYSEAATDVTMVTPESGKIVVKQLPYGEYYFIEKDAPEGYLVNDEPIAFAIEANQAPDDEPLVNKTCINSKVRANVSFMKADTVADKPLAGAVFTLYKAGAGVEGSDLEITDVTSDEKGYVAYSNLGIGKYYFVEKSTPENAYKLDTTKYTFTITEADNGKTVALENAQDNVVINYPRYGSVLLTKNYVVNGTIKGTLSNVVFGLFKVNPEGEDIHMNDYSTGAGGTIAVSSLEWGDYYFVEKSAPNGYKYDSSIKYCFTINQENVTVVQTVSVKDERTPGAVEIEKLDSIDNAPLNGVVFELYLANENNGKDLVATLTTKNGKASASGLLWGRYTLIEKSTIDGYVLNDVQYNFTIDGDNLVKSFTGVDAIKNDRIQGYVELLKKDANTKLPMSDVQFNLYKGTKSSSTFVGSYFTDEKGMLTDSQGNAKIGPLDFGAYYLQEVTPVGYVANDDVLVFSIEEKDQLVSFTNNKTVLNVPEDGAVILRKTDENGKPLKGAEFTLYASTPKTMGQTLSTLFKDAYEYGSYTTNSDGEIIVSNLPWDNYYFVESHAPRGYEIIEPGKKYSFTINASSTKAAIELATIKNRQQLGSLELTKLDSENHNPIEGAEFRLYKLESGKDTDVSARYGAEGGVFRTSTDGKITVDNVEWGSYYFAETKASQGYEAISELNEVKSSVMTINENNADAKTNIMQTQSATVYNQKGYGYVSLIKKFDGTQPSSLAGIEFTLINETNDSVVGTFKTNDDGVITADTIGKLTYGDYYFKEISVPMGVSYSVSNFKLAFTISESNPIDKPIEFTFTNSEIMASAKFVKIDTDTKEAISGIKFNVFNKANDSVPATIVTSDSQGVVCVKSLPMGDYYFLEDADSAIEAGYIADTTKYNFSITPEDKPTKDANGNIVEKFVNVYSEATGAAVTTVENVKANGKLQLIKLGRNQAGNESVLDISKAAFELYKDDAIYMDSAAVATCMNGDGLVIDNLPWGTYYFKEVKAPAGYVLPTNNKTNAVVIDASTVSDSLVTPLTCQICDDTTRVYVSKRVIGGSEELPGAVIELYEADDKGNIYGYPLTSWTSGTTSKLLEVGGDVSEGLMVGKKYVLHEDTAPIGYGLTTDITFSVNEDGSVNTDARVSGSKNGMTIIMEDAALNVSISKKEMGTEKELSGATLRIVDGEEVIEAWNTNGKPHVVTTPLTTGKSYVLEEINPPKGYYTAKPITFVVNTNGTIQITRDASASAEVSSVASSLGNASTLTMYDRPIRVEISKKRLSGGADDYVQGAELALYEQEGTEFKQIYAWTSLATGPVLINYGLLQVGNRYKIVETDAPAGFVKADDLYFTVKDYDDFEKTDANGMVTQSVDMFDDAVIAVISKQTITGGDELVGATLQVIDEDGKVVVEFISSEKRTLLTPVQSESLLSAEEKKAFENYNVIYGINLETGKAYTLREITSPDGYAVAEDIVFKVDESGKTVPNPIVMYDKPLEIKIGKKDISNDSYLAGAELELYDAANNMVASWVSGDKPVLLSTRTISAEEATMYSEVIPVKLPAGTYTLHEAKSPAGYMVAADIKITVNGACVKNDNGEIREEIMYDYKDGTTVFRGVKQWIEPRDNAGNVSTSYVYPEITIELYRDSAVKGQLDSTPYRSVTLTNGATNFAFGDLEKYRTNGGQNYEYTYKAVEVMSDSANKEYTSIELETTVDEDGLCTVIQSGFQNTLTQRYTSLEGTKTFILYKDDKGNVIKDMKYDDVSIYLLRNGSRVDIDGDGENDFVVIENGAVKSEGVATFEFKDLPMYDLSNGNEYKYTVEEVGADSYANEIVYSGNECSIVNIPKASPFRIEGTKSWLDPDGYERPDVTIQLYRDGKLYKETKLSANNTFSFEGLYEYNLGWSNDEGDMKATADGHKFVYEIKETGADGYDVSIDYGVDKLTVENGIAKVNITNKITQSYVELVGTKIWNDAGDSSKRPAVTINLYATDTCGRNKELVDTYVIPNTSSSYEFGVPGRKQLPMYDDNGKEIIYSVEEAALEGYISSISLNVITNTPSMIRISKIDASTREELPGAVLSLTRNSTKEEVERWKSTDVPHYMEALAIGEEYTLTEISAPAGYVVADPITFTVNAGGVEQVVTMEDDPIIGAVELEKLDSETRDKLTGAVFNLYTSDGKVVSATGSNGSYVYSKSGSGTTSFEVSGEGLLRITELPYGSYYFKEESAPEGYEISKDTISFSIVDQDASIAVSCLNTRKSGTVRLTKVDATGTTALAGAVFELYSKTPRTSGQAAASTVFSDAYYRYGTYTTDENGVIDVGDLPWDSYYFIETKAPDGYVTNRDLNGDSLVYSFEINAESVSTVPIVLESVKNSPGEVEGERVPEIVSGVLGVRAAPTSGVLGERVGPATGDASAIALWIALLVACVGTVIWLLSAKKKKVNK